MIENLLYCFIVLWCICVVSCFYVAYFPTVMARHSLIMLKMPLNPKQTNKTITIEIFVLCEHVSVTGSSIGTAVAQWRIEMWEITRTQQERTEPEPGFCQERNFGFFPIASDEGHGLFKRRTRVSVPPRPTWVIVGVRKAIGLLLLPWKSHSVVHEVSSKDYNYYGV